MGWPKPAGLHGVHHSTARAQDSQKERNAGVDQRGPCRGPLGRLTWKGKGGADFLQSRGRQLHALTQQLLQQQGTACDGPGRALPGQQSVRWLDVWLDAPRQTRRHYNCVCAPQRGVQQQQQQQLCARQSGDPQRRRQSSQQPRRQCNIR